MDKYGDDVRERSQEGLMPAQCSARTFLHSFFLFSPVLSYFLSIFQSSTGTGTTTSALPEQVQPDGPGGWRAHHDKTENALSEVERKKNVQGKKGANRGYREEMRAVMEKEVMAVSLLKP